MLFLATFPPLVEEDADADDVVDPAASEGWILTRFAPSGFPLERSFLLAFPVLFFATLRSPSFHTRRSCLTITAGGASYFILIRSIIRALFIRCFDDGAVRDLLAMGITNSISGPRMPLNLMRHL